MPRFTVLFPALALIAVSLAHPGTAAAKSEKSFTYSFDQVWVTTIRFIRADRGYPIKDKDKETGYILFTYPGEGKVEKCAASLEVVPYVDDNGYHKIRVKLKIAHQPSYVSIHFLDKLERKLFVEQGEPPAPRKAKRKKPAKKKEEGEDGKKKEGK